MGAARAGEGDRQPDVCGDVQSGARQGRLPGLGAQVRRPCWLCGTLWQSEMGWADASYARSMIVDPMGRIQTELDETEGIAYGEVGGCRAHTSPHARCLRCG